MLNLELPPFNFGPATQYVDDYVDGFPVRKLALWDRRELAKTFAVA